MSTSKTLFLSIIALMFTSSCSQEWFRSHNGNMPTNERVKKISLGMSKNEVRNNIGIPSNVISLDENTWIYMSSEMEQIAFFNPKEIDRDLLVLKFDEYDQIKDIQRMNKSNGKDISIDTQRTVSVGKKQGFFEKYFGGVGQYNPIGMQKSPQQP